MTLQFDDVTVKNITRVGQWVQNDRDAIERCTQRGPKKLTKTYNKKSNGFHNHST